MKSVLVLALFYRGGNEARNLDEFLEMGDTVARPQDVWRLVEENRCGHETTASHNSFVK